MLSVAKWHKKASGRKSQLNGGSDRVFGALVTHWDALAATFQTGKIQPNTAETNVRDKARGREAIACLAARVSEEIFKHFCRVVRHREAMTGINVLCAGFAAAA